MFQMQIIRAMQMQKRTSQICNTGPLRNQSHLTLPRISFLRMQNSLPLNCVLIGGIGLCFASTGKTES